MRHGVVAWFVVVSACGTTTPAEDACGKYFDSLVSLQNACATSLVDPGERSSFVAYCATITAAPGTKDLVGALGTCTAAASSAQCTNADAVATCNARGTLPDGSPCASSVQCAGGDCTGFKQQDPSSELQCGVCATFTPLGGACGATTTACDPTTAGCLNGTCAAPMGQGGDCHINPDTSCQAGLFCDFSTFTCQTPPNLGEACTGDCAVPYRCFNQTCHAPVSQGGSCASDPCAVGLTCIDNICTGAPVAQKGAPCGSAVCASGLVCQGTCQPPIGVGAPCMVGHKDCGRYLICVNGACAEPDLGACK